MYRFVLGGNWPLCLLSNTLIKEVNIIIIHVILRLALRDMFLINVENRHRCSWFVYHIYFPQYYRRDRHYYSEKYVQFRAKYILIKYPWRVLTSSKLITVTLSVKCLYSFLLLRSSCFLCCDVRYTAFVSFWCFS